MGRYFYAALMGLVGAAILHLTIIFMLPGTSENTGWIFVEKNATLLEPLEISNDMARGNQNFLLDPYFKQYICQFDLNEGAVRVTADANDLFWSLAVFDDTGNLFFSANDRISGTPMLDMTIVNRGQLRFVRQNTPEELSASLIAPAQNDQGYAIIRFFVPDESWANIAQEAASSIDCQQLEF